MTVAKSKLTSQCQISVPAEVRRRLGIGPGSVLDWDFVDDHFIVRRAGTFSSAEIHKALFPTPPAPRSVEEIDQGIARHLRKKHARR